MITRSAYVYKVSFNRNGSQEKEEKEFKSFTPMTRGDIVLEIIDDTNNISIGNLDVQENVVVLGVEDDDFLEMATPVNRKSNKTRKDEET